MRKARYILFAVLVAVVHFFVFVGSFTYGFGLGDGGYLIPAFLQAAIAVLGAPLMYLLYLPPVAFGNRWWGDDSNLIIGLAACNALLWGGSISMIVGWYRRRRARSHAAA